MLRETIILSETTPDVTLEAFYSAKGEPGYGILVVPGGAYSSVCDDREGGPIAEAFFSHGVNAFVLKYRVGEGHRYPEQLIDAARAISYIRANAEKYCVNPNKIFAVGFSAGGHLVGTLSTKYAEAERILGLDDGAARPDGTVYAYPVVSTENPTHGNSFYNLLGKHIDELTAAEREMISIEKCVKRDTPPAFIWHTAEDEAVPVLGSLRLAEAYVKAGVPVTLHVYPYGPHGVALGNSITANGNDAWLQPLAEGWVDYAVDFIKTL